MKYLLIANEWRRNNGYTDKGGVVYLWGDIAQGWSDELRPANQWRPGVIAVTDNGYLVAAGGDDDNGANRWEVCGGAA